MNGEPLLELRGVAKEFTDPRLLTLGGRRPPVRAVDDLNIVIHRGESFALVGESGSGKSTTARMVMRLDEPTRGTITFDGRDIQSLHGRGLREFRTATHIVFQDPNLSLSPRMRVGRIIAEPLDIHRVPAAEQRERVAEALGEVGLDPEVANRYPHEFSGGQRQRIAIARALAVRPELIVLDEPVSALDVSIRAQILNLLRSLQRRHGLTYLTIAHDLSVVYQVSDRTGVMLHGRLMELGATEEVFQRPLHPYTRSLVDAIPVPDPRRRNRRVALAEVANGELTDGHTGGCPFRSQCPLAEPRCAESTPEWREIEPDHWVSCHNAESMREAIVT